MVWIPAGLTLILGLWGIRRQDAVWRDEAVTYDMAHRGLPDLWATLLHVDVVHGLYYALMHGWFAVYDTTLGPALGDPAGPAIGLRLPSVAAMAAAAAGVALLGRELAGRRAGLCAGLVFALIPLVQQYAQEGRSYALVCALVVWASYALLRAAARSAPDRRASLGPRPGADPPRGATGRTPRPRRAPWLVYAALTLTACLLHEFAALALPAHGAAVVLARLPRRVRRSWALAAGGVLALLAPLAVFSTSQSDQLSWLLWPDPRQLLTFAALAALGCLCARVPVPARGPIGLRALALPLLLLPTVLLLLLSDLEPAYVERYVLYYLAGFALVAGAALARLPRPSGTGDVTGSRPRWGLRLGSLVRQAKWPLAVVALLAALLPVDIHLRSPDSRVDDVTAVARAVRQLSEPGDGLLFAPSRRRIWAATRPQDFRGLRDLALARGPVASRTLYGTELSGDEIRARMLASRRIVVAGDPAGQPLDTNDQELAKRATLRSAFTPCETRTVRGARITVYARVGGPGGGGHC
ncbi:hypothetical protein ADL22_31745 [Streptomyces sp. NRRL F-4489]|nr:hypothetical protein ADL22_31745 [Streptomyces sp. NRRL F-4489]